MMLNDTDKQSAKAWLADLQKYLIKNGEWFEQRHVAEALAAFKAGLVPEAVATMIADAEYHRRAEAIGNAAERERHFRMATTRVLPRRPA